jgi:hypothetical protein
MSDLTVANTILNQLGGNRFRVMTGAKNLVGDNNTLRFTLPRGFAQNKVNCVQVKLDVTDTYTITFYNIKRSPSHEVKVIREFSDVYADSLQTVFTEITGLSTRL